MTAPDRIWAWTSGQAAGIFDTSFHDNVGSATEYIRADLAAVQPAQVRSDDICGIVEGFFEAVSDDDDWYMSDLHDHIRESMRIAAIEPQPISKSADLHDPRDGVIKGLVEALGECRQAITDYMNQYPHMAKGYLVDAEQHARAALAAAKAVQHD